MVKKRIFLCVLCVIFVISFIAAISKYTSLVREDNISEELYHSYEKFVAIPAEDINSPDIPPIVDTDSEVNDTSPENKTDTPPSDTVSADDTEKSTPETSVPEENIFPIVDFDSLLSLNEDVVGWIYIEGTNINYPIVIGEDNKEYLNKMIDGEINRAGSIFMDYRNHADFSDRNTVIYGHRLSNKTMFTALKDYKKQSFYDSHPSFVIMTPENNYEVLIFSAYIANLNDDAWKIGFSDDEEYGNWLSGISGKSMIETNITPSESDRVITLSTCTYEFNNARFIVHGIIK